MILQLVQPSDLNDNKIGRRVTQIATYAVSRIGGGLSKLACVCAIINQFHSSCRQSFVGDQSLSDRFAAGDNSILSPQQQSVDDHSTSAGSIRKMTAMFGKDNGPAA